MERKREAIISPEEYMAAPAREEVHQCLFFCSVPLSSTFFSASGNNQGRVAAARPRGMFCAGVPGNCKRNQFNRSPPSVKNVHTSGKWPKQPPGEPGPAESKVRLSNKANFAGFQVDNVFLSPVPTYPLHVWWNAGRDLLQRRCASFQIQAFEEATPPPAFSGNTLPFP